jgi:Rieske Fe-S protein
MAAASKLDWFDIGLLEDIPEGSSVVVEKARRAGHNTPLRIKPVIVHRKGQEAHILSAVCTHQSCTLKVAASGELFCPCHGAKFSPAGAVLKGPATAPLGSVPFKIEEGHVLVNWMK